MFVYIKTNKFLGFLNPFKVFLYFFSIKFFPLIRSLKEKAFKLKKVLSLYINLIINKDYLIIIYGRLI